jgi:arylsulfatase A-like enzyme
MTPAPGPAAYLVRAVAIALLSALVLAFAELTYALSAPAPLAGALNHLGLFALLVLALGLFAVPWGLLQGLLAWAVSRWRRARAASPAPPRTWRRVLRLSAGAVGVAACIAVYLVNASQYVRLYHEIHRYLTVAIFVGLNVAFLLLTWHDPVRGAGRAKVAFLFATPALLAGAVVGLHVILDGREALKAWAFDRSTVLSHGLDLLSRIADLDGDRYSALLAGGDCAEGDPGRHPAAREIVGNGIDENCTGADLTPADVEAARAELAPEAAGGPATRARRPWSVLLLTVDALRWDRVDTFSQKPVAPWMVRAWQSGVTFRTAYGAGSWTNSSVYALFTSRFPSQVRWTTIAITEDDRIVIDPRPPSALRGLLEHRRRMPAPIFDRSPTMAEILGRAGYTTATFPSYLFFLRNIGLTRGFEVNDSSPYHALRRGHGGKGGDLVATRALEFMERMRREDRRFFAWVHLMEPHEPYRGPSDLSAEARYGLEVARADAQVGRILQWLARAKMHDRTVVILTSDHGEELRDHGGEYHGTTVYDEVVRVPLVFLVPNTRPRLVGGVVSQVDIFPTVLDLLGLPRPPGLMGRSLAPWIEGRPGIPPRRPILAEAFRFESEKRALIEGGYKLILDRRHNTMELYERRRDLLERENLVDAQPERARAMRARLERFAEVLELDGLDASAEPAPPATSSAR